MSLVHLATKILYILYIISSSEVAKHWARDHFIAALFYDLPAQMLGVA